MLLGVCHFDLSIAATASPIIVHNDFHSEGHSMSTFTTLVYGVLWSDTSCQEVHFAHNEDFLL